MSFSRIAFTRPPASSAPPLPNTPFLRPSRSRGGTFPLLRQNTDPLPSMPTLDLSAEAKHYTDPEARMKLRLYLASPQKFDEALEFGFPSSDTIGTAISTDSERPIPGKRTPSNNTHRFSSEDRSSFLDEYKDDDDDDNELNDYSSDSDSDGPSTPEADTVLFHAQRTQSNFSSIDSGVGLLPLSKHLRTHDPYAQPLFGNREMTLRMTLTRPDLLDDDPLALETLQLTEDQTGAHGVFAVKMNHQAGAVRKLWRLMRQKKA
ncbi:hypothetical protein LTR39_002499 [Cryomyces antarcticus]|nr:hypothetical protein LTR39_002499 [Cryomyces antarcticus]